MRGSSKLSADAAKAIEDITKQIFISAVSAYEITNKFRIGKLPEFEDVVNNYFDYVKKLDVVSLAINEHHSHYAG